MSPRHRPWEEAADFQIGVKSMAPAHGLQGGEADPAARNDCLMASLAEDPDRPAAFAHAWRTASAELRAYKRFDLYGDLVESFPAAPSQA